MSLVKKLLAGLSSVALLAGFGIGAHQVLAQEDTPASLGDPPARPITAMTLAELQAFVSANVNPSAPSAVAAAAEFGRSLGCGGLAGEPDGVAAAAITNALGFMLEDLAAAYGAIDADAAVASARSACLTELVPAAGPLTVDEPAVVDPDAGPFDDPAVY